MRNRCIIILCVLIILIISLTLCFGDNGKKKTIVPEEWWDLSEFKDFLEQDFDVTYKKEDGSNAIRSISEPDKTLYIVVGIDEPFSGLEAEALHNFVKAGGNLFVACDNHTNVNPLSQKFGIEYSEHIIIYRYGEEDRHETFLPVLANTENMTFHILVHSPLGLELPDDNYKIIAESMSAPDRAMSVLDLNDNNGIDGTDRLGPIPIIVEVSENKGKAVFISDAGMFSNDLWRVTSVDEDFPGRTYQNNEFIIDLVYELSAIDGEVIFDTSKQTAGFSNYHGYPD